jgi:hypothetical protein
LDLSGYPQGSRVIARREPLHPGAQQTIEDIDGARFTAFLTDRLTWAWPAGTAAIASTRMSKTGSADAL